MPFLIQPFTTTSIFFVTALYSMAGAELNHRHKDFQFLHFFATPGIYFSPGAAGWRLTRLVTFV